MGRLIAGARYVAVVGVVFALVGSVAGFGWGAVKTLVVCARLVRGQLDGVAVALVQTMDAFLIASGLLIFALGLYELFVGAIALPRWLVVGELDVLEEKLAGLVTLVMAVAFLERLETGEDARALLYSGVAVALVALALVAFMRLPKKH